MKDKQNPPPIVLDQEEIRNLYAHLPDAILEVCEKMGTTPEKLGIDIYADEKEKENYWDMNPQKRKNLFRFETINTECSQCKSKTISGKLILDKKTLRVVDSSGFMILFDEILCDSCLQKDREVQRRKGNLLKK
jgi:hypothetical protein